MRDYLILLPIAIPVIGGFCMIPLHLKSDRARAVYSECIALLTTALVFAVIALHRGPLTVYEFTGGFSITFQTDGLSSLFAGMVAVMWPLVLLYAFEYMENDARRNVFFVFYVMTYGITLGVAFSADMITMYVFFEMLTLVTIPLVSHYGDHESMYAGRKYAAYTIFGASLGFIAVVLTTIYGDAGVFRYGGSLLEGGYDPFVLRIAFLLGFFGFGAKAAIFPLHDWLPVASAAPTPVTALLHAVAVVNSGVFAVIRMTYYVYGTGFLSGSVEQRIALCTAVFTMLFAAVMALRERHVKRRLAYSTMSNLSYMLFGIMLMSPAGLFAGTLHMVFHSVIKMSLFLCAGAFMHKTGGAYIYEVNGVGRHMRVTFACYTLGALSLTGIPLFCGFISKWQLLTAGFAAGTPEGYLGDAALIAAAFLCAMYTLTITVRAFFTAPAKDHYADRTDVRDPGLRMLLPIVLFTVLNVSFGILPGPVMELVRSIAGGTW